MPTADPMPTVVLGAEFLNETTGEVSGCLDHELQRTVPVGDWYHSHNCEICLCSPTHRMCKQVYCAPPESCDGFWEKEPNVCCDVCVPVHVEREHGREGFNLRLGIGTVILFCLLFLLLFAFYRLRKKRSFHRCHLGRRSEEEQEEGAEESVAGQTSVGTTETDAVVCLDGYAFPEAPPPYQTRLPSPSLSVRLSEVGPRVSPQVSPALGEPPPPYASDAVSVLPPVPPLPLPPPDHPPLHALRQGISPAGGVGVRVFPVSPVSSLRPRSPSAESSSSASSSASSRSSSSSSSASGSSCCTCSECERSLGRSRESLQSSETVPYTDGDEGEAGASREGPSTSRSRTRKRLRKLLQLRSAKCKRKASAAPPNGAAT